MATKKPEINLEKIEEMEFQEIKELVKNLESKQIETMSFSIALKLVERISEFYEFNRDSIDIEEALELYEKAMELLSLCKEKLSAVENKKEEIDKKYREILKTENNSNS
jgi:exodeoxyribonuclease VII small subunit